MSRTRRTSFLLLLLVLLTPGVAHAYIDPGSASMIYQLSMTTSTDELYTAVEDGLIKMEYRFSQYHPNLVRAIRCYTKVLKDRGDDKRLEEVRERVGSFEKSLARKLTETY